MVSIAVDGMGGDKAPGIIVKGLDLFHNRCPEVSFLLYGDNVQLKALIKQYSSLSKVTTIVHTDEIVSIATKPSHAIRSLKRSSMRMALEAVASGDASGVISAGNTGAYMALCKLILKTIPGISRPAIAKNNISTELLIDDGDTIVIGGVVKATQTKSTAGWPFLSKLPVIGWLFKSRTDEETKKELLIFLTPRIATFVGDL